MNTRFLKKKVEEKKSTLEKISKFDFYLNCLKKHADYRMQHTLSFNLIIVTLYVPSQCYLSIGMDSLGEAGSFTPADLFSD